MVCRQQLRNCIPVGIHFWSGACDQESTNHSAQFVEWKSSYITIMYNSNSTNEWTFVGSSLLFADNVIHVQYLMLNAHKLFHFWIHLISAYRIFSKEIFSTRLSSSQNKLVYKYTVHVHVKLPQVYALVCMYIMWKFWFLVLNSCLFASQSLFFPFVCFYICQKLLYLTKCDSPWVLAFHVAMTAFRGWNLLPVIRVWIV